jgi:hypothetical protein
MIISAASGLPQSYIAVSLYSSASVNNETLLGIWSGGLNLPVFSETFVFYEPVQFHSTTWAVLLLKPV